MDWSFLPYITAINPKGNYLARQNWEAQNYPTERRELITSLDQYQRRDQHELLVMWDCDWFVPSYHLSRMVAFQGRRVPVLPDVKLPVFEPIICPKTEQYTRLIAECFPSDALLQVMEFGRLRAHTQEILDADGGSTLQLARSPNVTDVISIDPDMHTVQACRKYIDDDGLLDKVELIEDLQRMTEYDPDDRGFVDLLIIDANDCSWQNLDLMRSAERFTLESTIIAVDDQQHQVKPFLIREVLRGTHYERTIGDLAVFVPMGGVA